MKRTKILLLLVFWALTQKAFSQTDQTIKAADQKSNKSATGGSTNIYNMDLYTGTANVSIPIFGYTVDGLDLGVSLSYNTKGVKVDQIASSTGLGWDLNGIGYIQRDVHGTEDECVIPAITPTDWEPLSASNNQPRMQEQRGIWCTTDPSASNEQEYDVFTAVFAGRTIKFVVDFNRVGGPIAYVSPKSEVKVTLLFNDFFVGAQNKHWVNANCPSCTGPNIDSNLLSFIITDEQGNRFYYSPTDYTQQNVRDIDSTIHMDYCNTCSPSSPGGNSTNVNYYPTTKWSLTKVESYSGATTTYTYTTFPASYLAYRNNYVMECSGFTLYGGAAAPAFTSLQTNTVSNWTGQLSHISKITYPNGTTLTFNLDNSRCDIPSIPSLYSVEIGNPYPVVNKIIYQFNYKYFTVPFNNWTATEANYGPTTCSAMQTGYGTVGSTYDPSLGSTLMSVYSRLKLVGITRVGMDNTTTEPYYSFSYNTTTLAPRLLPGQDWYGYYNNGYDSTLAGIGTGIPRHTSMSGVTYGVDKTPNFTYAQAGVLTEAKNGQGGTTDFYYKDFSLVPLKDSADQIYDIESRVQLGYLPPIRSGGYSGTWAIDPDLQGGGCDGLVLDKIITSDGYNHDNDVTVKYDYMGGERFYAGAYYWVPDIFTDNTLTTCAQRFYFNHQLNPQELVHGSNHGFRNVFVTTTGYGGQQLDKIKYVFSGLYWSPTQTNLRIVGGIFNHTMPRYKLYDAFMGLPMETTHYDPSGNVLSDELNTYGTHSYRWTDTFSNGSSFNQNWRYPNYDGYVRGYDFMPADIYDETIYCALPNTSNNPTIVSLPVLTQTTSTQYAGSASQSTSVAYAYDNVSFDNVISETWTDSKGSTIVKKYDWDYFATPDGYAVNDPDSLQFVHGHTIVKDGVTISEDHANSMLSGPYVYTMPYLFSIPGSTIHLGTYYLNQAANVYSSSVDPISGFSYYKIKDYTKFDAGNNAIETKFDIPNTYASAIWDTRIGKVSAQATNAQFTDIAYTSFEGTFTATPPGTSDYLKGNWEFDPTQVVLGTSMTGHYSFAMSPSNPSNIVRNVNPLPLNKQYIISFWAKGNVPLVYTGAYPQTIPPTPIYTTLTPQTHAGVWTLYTGTVTGTQDDVYIIPQSGGPNLNIDELRLYPVGSKMDTYTYESLFGLNMHDDEHSNITFYDYDVFGRPFTVRDINGNIIQLNKTVNQGIDN
jgi:hypothetical protein